MKFSPQALSSPLMASPHEILKQFWGYDSFRPLQEEIIQSVMDGKDTLALLPTGGGKSICFQVPALCMEGMCLVISPLIALMKDQVEHLLNRNISAAAIYSGMSKQEIDRILDNAAHGHYQLLYVSPERLKTELMKARMARMNINLIAVDESHCISQWGYDFRPSYLEIAEIRTILPDANIIALTATATREVVQDIQEKLLFKNPNIFQKSFERKNLSYSVLYEEGKEEKLVKILQAVKGSGIVYVRNRKKCKDIAWMLSKNKIPADYYHAGLSPAQRDKKQAAWMKNHPRIIVSTNAFGMGIDKPNVRVVVHLSLPDSLEAYFQEAGRAGRDGQKAYAVLLYNEEDKFKLEQSYKTSFPPLKEVLRVYQALGSYFQLAIGGGMGRNFDFDLINFSKTYQFHPFKTFSCLKILEQSNLILLTDAVYIPSQLKLLISKEELYDYLLKNPKMDLVLKSILRNYQGAFRHFIKIKEGQLAAFLKMPKEQLIKTLQTLAHAKVIHYIPQKNEPQLIYTKARYDASELDIDYQLYNFRKKKYKERYQAAVSYAETIMCRSQLLLGYFSQTNAPKCGICDVCTGRTKPNIPTSDFAVYKEKIQQLLDNNPATLEEIVTIFPPQKESEVLFVIDYLVNEGFLVKNDQKFNLPPTN